MQAGLSGALQWLDHRAPIDPLSSPPSPQGALWMSPMTYLTAPDHHSSGQPAPLPAASGVRTVRMRAIQVEFIIWLLKGYTCCCIFCTRA